MQIYFHFTVMSVPQLMVGLMNDYELQYEYLLADSAIHHNKMLVQNTKDAPFKTRFLAMHSPLKLLTDVPLQALFPNMY